MADRPAPEPDPLVAAALAELARRRRCTNFGPTEAPPLPLDTALEITPDAIRACRTEHVGALGRCRLEKDHCEPHDFSTFAEGDDT